MKQLDQQRRLLYLFSSNIRPLYIQDILDVLAAPEGTHYRFRYEEQYADAGVRVAELAGMEALVHFSIQQEARYHDPAFIPIRRGKVVAAASEAGILVVTFELGSYVALKRAEPEDLRSAVTTYTSALAEVGVPRPYDASISVGADLRAGVSPFDDAADAAAAFRSTAELLQRTESFKNARFLRFLSLREDGADVGLKDRSFHLRAGLTSELSLSHYQPADVSAREPFAVDADEAIIRVVGRRGFDIASRYDVVRLTLHAMSSGARQEKHQTILTVRPEEGVHGSTLRLPLTVASSWKRTLPLVGLSTGVLILFGLPAVFTTWNPSIKAVLVLGGALGVSLLQNLGWSVVVPSGFGYTGRPESAAKTDASSGGRHSPLI